MSEKIYTIKGSTLTGMANALRSGLGDIGPIKGDELEARTLEVVGMIGSGGGGGGSLPAGVYLSAHPIKAATNYRHKRFMYNGELYATYCTYAGSGAASAIYKWDGSAWGKVLDVPSSPNLDSSGFSVAEYNGKAHIFSGKNHFVFNGTTLAQSTAVPKTVSGALMYQGKMLVYYADSGSLYEWDEANSTWVSVIALNIVTSFFAVNNVLYYWANAQGDDKTYKYRLYRYENGTFVEIYVFSSSIKQFAVVNNVWYFKQGLNLCRFDFDANEPVVLGVFPDFANVWVTENANEFSFIGTTYSSNSQHPCFLVTIVEETE